MVRVSVRVSVRNRVSVRVWSVIDLVLGLELG